MKRRERYHLKDDVVDSIRSFLYIHRLYSSSSEELADEVIETCREAISVDDRLPEPGQWVLAHYTPTDCWQVAMYRKPATSIQFDCYGKERMRHVRDPFDSVDYWQELPIIPTESE